jgi:inorganic pyrophosphatase
VAEAELRAHLTAHEPALVAELATEANRVTADLRAAEAKARKLTDAPRAEYGAIVSTLQTTLGRSDFDPADIFEAHRQPVEPEPVEAVPVTA